MNMLLREHIDHRVLVLAPAVPLASVVLDDLVDLSPQLQVQARVYDSRFAPVASKFDAG